jgi:hypothetical protein
MCWKYIYWKCVFKLYAERKKSRWGLLIFMRIVWKINLTQNDLIFCKLGCRYSLREEKLGKRLNVFSYMGKEHFNKRCVSDIFQTSVKVCRLFLLNYCITVAESMFASVIWVCTLMLFHPWKWSVANRWATAFSRSAFKYRARQVQCTCFIFLSTFTILQKATISSVCSSVCVKQLTSYWMDFYEIRYLSMFWKFIKKIQVPLNSDKNNGYFTWRPIYVFDHTW